MSTIMPESSALAASLESKPALQRSIVEYLVLFSFFIIVGYLVPEDESTIGAFSALPSLFLLSFIFYTKRILEGLTLAALLAFIMADKGAFFTPLNETLTEVLTDGDTQWLFIVCGLMGSIIALIEKAGGAQAFGEWVAKRAKTRRSTLLWTWVLGVVIFIDDYLNCLTVGSCMAPINDKHKVSREKLAYIVDSTAAPVCVLIPISTWAVYIASLLEQAQAVPEGEGMKMFIQTIPYNIYGWVAALVVPLVILGLIPVFGPMKAAEKRAQETGELAPPGSAKIDIKGGQKTEITAKPKIMNFFLPILVLVASTIYFDIDMQMGVLTTVGFTFLLYIFQGIMTPEEFFDSCVTGIKHMLFPLLMVILALTFASANEKIGFLTYVIETAQTFMTPAMMPVVVFIVLGITEFIMGLSWGMYAIAIPIVIPLAVAIGANPVVAVGAVCSAGVFGSHICFYSDATILSSAATGCDNYRHAVTQMPFGFLAAAISLVGFVIIGMLGI